MIKSVTFSLFYHYSISKCQSSNESILRG